MRFNLSLAVFLSLVFFLAGCDTTTTKQNEPAPELASEKEGAATLHTTPMKPGEELLPPGFNDKSILADSSSAYGCYLASSPYTDDVQVRSIYLHFPEGMVKKASDKTTSIVFRLLAPSNGGEGNVKGVRYAHCIVPDTPKAEDLAMREVIRKGEQRALAIAAGAASN